MNTTLTSSRPTKYPKASWRKCMFPLKARPGTLMKVSVLVSLATIEKPTDHHDISLPPRK
jgi:hypothetical protein